MKTNLESVVGERVKVGVREKIERVFRRHEDLSMINEPH